MGSLKIFLGKRENVFLGELAPKFHFWEIQFWKKSQHNTGGAYA